MKKTNIIYFFITFALSVSIGMAMHPAAKSTQKTSSTDHTKLQSLLFTTSMPTTSIQENNIDAIYGKQGLNISSDTIKNIKQTYSYIETLVKLEKISSDPTLAHYKPFFATFATKYPGQNMLNSQEWKSIVITGQDITTSSIWQLYLKSAIVDYFENQADFAQTIRMIQEQMFPFLANIEVNFYNNDFIQLKNFAELLRTKKALQDAIFQRNIQQCIDWKSHNTTTLLQEIETFKHSDFYLYTHNAPTSTTKQLSHPLQEQIVAYFMLTTMQSQIDSMLNQEHLFSLLTQASSQTMSPNFFIYTLADFVYLDNILTLQKLLKQSPSNHETDQKTFNISDFVDTSTQQNSVKIQSITNDEFDEEPDDVVIQQTSSITKSFNKSLNSTKKTFDNLGKDLKKSNEAAQKAIVGNLKPKDFANVFIDSAKVVSRGAQGIGYGLSGKSSKALSSFKASGRSLKKIEKDLKRFGVLSIVMNGAEGFVLGAAGFGATMIGDIAYAQTGNASIKNWGEKESKKAIADIQAAGKAMDQAIKNTATAIEAGIIAPIAEIDGTLIGFVLQDQQIGKDITTCMTQIADAAVNIAANSFIAVNDFQINEAVQVYRVSESAAQLMLDASLVVVNGATGQTAATHRSEKLFTNTSKKFAKDMSLAMSQSLSCIMHSATNVMMSAVVGLSAIENAMTTIVFDTVREITFLGAGLGQLMGAPINAAQEREAITTKMNAHRGTINIVMSVILTIAVTVLTLGAAAPAAPEIIAAEIAAQTTTKVAVEVTAQTALKVGAEAAAQTTAKATVEAVGQTTLKTGAETALKTGAKEVAGQTLLKTGAETAGNSALKTGTEEVAGQATAKTTAETAAQSTTKVTTEAVAETAAETGETLATQTSSTGVKLQAFLTANAGELIGQALNAVMNVFSIIAGNNQDESAAQQLIQEKASIVNLWQYIENNKAVVTQEQDAYLNELSKKHLCAIENQRLGLTYYQNYLNSSVNTITHQIAQSLAEQYIQLLTPDENGSRLADIGSPWGLTTQFLYLYPSQGFLTTTLGRPDFPYAQEIAQAPLVAQTTNSSSTSTALADGIQETASNLWSNQRAISIIHQADNAPLDVEISFRILYQPLTEFHCGLYLGGTFYDYNAPSYLTSLKNSGIINLDAAHKAKMFVLQQEHGDTTPSIAIYENEGTGLLSKKAIDNNLVNATKIYHMKASLNKDQLTVSFWIENDPTFKWDTTVTVAPCDQKTFGIIFSGAALEWNVITPTLSIKENNSIRTSAENESTQAPAEIKPTPQSFSQRQAQAAGTVVTNNNTPLTKVSHATTKKQPATMTPSSTSKLVISTKASKPPVTQQPTQSATVKKPASTKTVATSPQSSVVKQNQASKGVAEQQPAQSTPAKKSTSVIATTSQSGTVGPVGFSL